MPLAGYSVVSMGIDGNVPESITLVEAGMVLVLGTNWGVTLEHEFEPKDCGSAVAVERLVAEEVFVVVYVMSLRIVDLLSRWSGWLQRRYLLLYMS